MKFKNVKHYLKKLVIDGHQWQNIDVNGKESQPRFYFSQIQWFLIVVAISSLFILKKGLNKDFVGYIIASLSIFVGLFMTLILTMFDKFEKIDFSEAKKSEKKRVSLIQRKNFLKQFTALTSYSILISLGCIFLLSISLLTPVFQRDVFEYEFVLTLANIGLKELLTFFLNTIIVIHRLTVIYFFLDFLLMVLYALSSVYTYISVQYNKVQID